MTNSTMSTALAVAETDADGKIPAVACKQAMLSSDMRACKEPT